MHVIKIYGNNAISAVKIVHIYEAESRLVDFVETRFWIRIVNNTIPDGPAYICHKIGASARLNHGK
ncbi:MAG TPA: hypothetical protein VK566_10065 [Nitrososphaeraceae archaeon]|nr:hypothetical protein [Nitrososphaeraceae archaeon]